MKNLYWGIGLSGPTDSSDEIQRAIAQRQGVDSEIAAAAAFILLDAHRKRIYDSTHTALIRIGQLRANLGLKRSPLWAKSDCSEFEPEIAFRTSRLREWRHKSAAPAKTSRGTKLFAIVVIASIVVFIIASLRSQGVIRHDQRQVRPAQPQYRPPAVPMYKPPVAATAPPDPQKIRRQLCQDFVTRRLELSNETAEPALVDFIVGKMMRGDSLPLPRTEVLSRNHFGAALAPLEIRTLPGSNYYIKVVPWGSGRQPTVTAFVRGGERFEANVPLGSYEIKYAAGQQWFGELFDFGPNAAYSRCDDRFIFSDSGSHYSGYTVELIMQQRGNLQTEPISADEF